MFNKVTYKFPKDGCKEMGENTETVKEAIKDFGATLSTFFLRHEFLRSKTVKCDKCKCILDERDAIRGKSRVVEKSAFNPNNFPPVSSEEEIEKVYYCHRCAPKSLKNN